MLSVVDAAIDLVLAGSLRQSAPALITFEGGEWTAVTRGCMLLAIRGAHLGAEPHVELTPQLTKYLAKHTPDVWESGRPLRDLRREIATEWGVAVHVLDCDECDRFNPRLLETLLLAFDDGLPIRWQIHETKGVPSAWFSQPNVIASLAATTADQDGQIRLGAL